MTGGRCTGGALVRETFEAMKCGDCHFRELTDEGYRCQVLDGRDAVTECPELQDFIRYHGIRLKR